MLVACWTSDFFRNKVIRVILAKLSIQVTFLTAASWYWWYCRVPTDL